MESMDRSYGLSDKGTIHVINFLKQRIISAGAKIRRYNQRNLQYRTYRSENLKIESKFWEAFL